MFVWLVLKVAFPGDELRGKSISNSVRQLSRSDVSIGTALVISLQQTLSSLKPKCPGSPAVLRVQSKNGKLLDDFPGKSADVQQEASPFAAVESPKATQGHQ